MMALELKILALTLIYFVGWFTVEKGLGALWDWWKRPSVDAKPPTKTPALRAVPGFGTITPLDQTGRYLRGLKSPDWKVRRISAMQLGEKRGSQVVAALIDALDDPREEVSIAAGESLARIGDPQAIEALTRNCERLQSSLPTAYERSRKAA